MRSTMRLLGVLALGAMVQLASAAVGFTTYKEIDEGADNSDVTAYSDLMDLSTTLFLYVQITPWGGDHADIIADFKTLAQNYGSQGISMVPRVRYGYSNGTVTPEPAEDILMSDVDIFVGVYEEVGELIDIPVIQAGFLGEWGEWHDGQYCQARGTDDTAEDLAIKKEVVEKLLGTGYKVALRYPQDHQALYNGNRTVTIHDDCIFDGGANGYDGGSFPDDDRQTWVDYTIQVAGNNTFGGEGCNNAGTSTYNWSDTSSLCGSDGLAAYIDTMEIAYMNWETPDPFEAMFDDSSDTTCIDTISEALLKWS